MAPWSSTPQTPPSPPPTPQPPSSLPSPPSRNPFDFLLTDKIQQDPEAHERLIRFTTLGALVACPILIALPPRKLDFYTVALVISTGVAGNAAMKQYTGRSVGERLKGAVVRVSAPQLPEKARLVSERLKAEKEERERRRGGLVERRDGKKEGVLDAVDRMEVERRREEAERKKQGLVQKVWMGGEGSDWKEKRDQREKEALEDGRGYGGLIMDQIWEVWSWGKGKNGDGGADGDKNEKDK